jgi:hypothetical protein
MQRLINDRLKKDTGLAEEVKRLSKKKDKVTKDE